MTEQLKTMMDRAATQDFATVDLDAITAAGDRTVRRRRVVTGVAGVAVLAVVGASTLLFGGDGDGKADVVDDPFRTDVPMWTEGSTLHTPEGTYDLGIDVASFVRTSDGIAFLGWESDDAFGVYSFSGEGEPTLIGKTQDSRLRADSAEPFVGWLDGTGEDLETVIYDQSVGERVYSEPARREFSYPIVAIDGDQAYLAAADEGPTSVVDLVSGNRTDLPGDEIYRSIIAVEGDLVARRTVQGDATGLAIGSFDGTGTEVELPGVDADGAVFSPDGRWISTFGGAVTVHATTTGEEVFVETEGYSDGLGYEWLDDDTLMVLGAARDTNEIVLLSCEIPDGRCTRQATLPDLEGSALAAIGLGELIWGGAGEASGSADVTMEAEETSSTDRPE